MNVPPTILAMPTPRVTTRLEVTAVHATMDFQETERFVKVIRFILCGHKRK